MQTPCEQLVRHARTDEERHNERHRAGICGIIPGTPEDVRYLRVGGDYLIYWMKESGSWYLKYLNVIDPSAAGTIAVYESNTPEENSTDITKTMVVYPEEGSSRLKYYDLLSGT
ncbi:MAG: hypothetical protein DRN95_07925, partial [Candidatus Hydrothermarchaeota archaeon]